MEGAKATNARLVWLAGTKFWDETTMSSQGVLQKEANWLQIDRINSGEQGTRAIKLRERMNQEMKFMLQVNDEGQHLIQTTDKEDETGK